MSRSYVIIGTMICLLTAFANFTGWRVLAAPGSSWSPKGVEHSSTFRHK